MGTMIKMKSALIIIKKGAPAARPFFRFLKKLDYPAMDLASSRAISLYGLANRMIRQITSA